jgi:hypothetical protein
MAAKSAKRRMDFESEECVVHAVWQETRSDGTRHTMCEARVIVYFPNGKSMTAVEIFELQPND